MHCPGSVPRFSHIPGSPAAAAAAAGKFQRSPAPQNAAATRSMAKATALGGADNDGDPREEELCRRGDGRSSGEPERVLLPRRT